MKHKDTPMPKRPCDRRWRELTGLMDGQSDWNVITTVVCSATQLRSRTSLTPRTSSPIKQQGQRVDIAVQKREDSCSSKSAAPLPQTPTDQLKSRTDVESSSSNDTQSPHGSDFEPSPSVSGFQKSFNEFVESVSNISEVENVVDVGISGVNCLLDDMTRPKKAMGKFEGVMIEKNVTFRQKRMMPKRDMRRKQPSRNCQKVLRKKKNVVAKGTSVDKQHEAKEPKHQRSRLYSLRENITNVILFQIQHSKPGDSKGKPELTMKEMGPNQPVEQKNKQVNPSCRPTEESMALIGNNPCKRKARLETDNDGDLGSSNPKRRKKETQKDAELRQSVNQMIMQKGKKLKPIIMSKHKGKKHKTPASFMDGKPKNIVFRPKSLFSEERGRLSAPDEGTQILTNKKDKKKMKATLQNKNNKQNPKAKLGDDKCKKMTTGKGSKEKPVKTLKGDEHQLIALCKGSKHNPMPRLQGNVPRAMAIELDDGKELRAIHKDRRQKSMRTLKADVSERMSTHKHTKPKTIAHRKSIEPELVSSPESNKQKSTGKQKRRADLMAMEVLKDGGPEPNATLEGQEPDPMAMSRVKKQTQVAKLKEEELKLMSLLKDETIPMAKGKRNKPKSMATNEPDKSKPQTTSKGNKPKPAATVHSNEPMAMATLQTKTLAKQKDYKQKPVATLMKNQKDVRETSKDKKQTPVATVKGNELKVIATHNDNELQTRVITKSNKRKRTKVRSILPRLTTTPMNDDQIPMAMRKRNEQQPVATVKNTQKNQMATTEDVQELMATSKDVPELMATTEDALELMATTKNVPEMVATTKLVPELMATTIKDVPVQIATIVDVPVRMAMTKDVPELMATTKDVPEMMATTKNVPELMATTKLVPELMATTEDVPELDAKGKGKTIKAVGRKGKKRRKKRNCQRQEAFMLDHVSDEKELLEQVSNRLSGEYPGMRDGENGKKVTPELYKQGSIVQKNNETGLMMSCNSEEDELMHGVDKRELGLLLVTNEEGMNELATDCNNNQEIELFAPHNSVFPLAQYPAEEEDLLVTCKSGPQGLLILPYPDDELLVTSSGQKLINSLNDGGELMMVLRDADEQILVMRNADEQDLMTMEREGEKCMLSGQASDEQDPPLTHDQSVSLVDPANNITEEVRLATSCDDQQKSSDTLSIPEQELIASLCSDEQGPCCDEEIEQLVRRTVDELESLVTRGDEMQVPIVRNDLEPRETRDQEPFEHAERSTEEVLIQDSVICQDSAARSVNVLTAGPVIRTGARKGETLAKTNASGMDKTVSNVCHPESLSQMTSFADDKKEEEGSLAQSKIIGQDRFARTVAEQEPLMIGCAEERATLAQNNVIGKASYLRSVACQDTFVTSTIQEESLMLGREKAHELVGICAVEQQDFMRDHGSEQSSPGNDNEEELLVNPDVVLNEQMPAEREKSAKLRKWRNRRELQPQSSYGLRMNAPKTDIFQIKPAEPKRKPEAARSENQEQVKMRQRGCPKKSDHVERIAEMTSEAEVMEGPVNEKEQVPETMKEKQDRLINHRRVSYGLRENVPKIDLFQIRPDEPKKKKDQAETSRLKDASEGTSTCDLANSSQPSVSSETRSNLMEPSTNEQEPLLGKLVWARFGGHRWWPGIVVRGNMCCLRSAKYGKSWIYWFGDHKVSEVGHNKIRPFTTDFCELLKKSTAMAKLFHKAVVEAIQVCSKRADFSPGKDDGDLVLWAENGFKVKNGKSLQGQLDEPKGDQPFPEFVLDDLTKLSAKIKRNKEDRDEDERERECDVRPTRLEVLEQRKTSAQVDALSEIKAGRRAITDTCLACASTSAVVMVQHPFFDGGLCETCKEELMDTMFAFGADGTGVFCIICGNGGDLFVCDRNACNRVYCTGCIVALVGQAAIDLIHKTDPWLCFMCSDYKPETHGLLVKKANWQQNVLGLFNHIVGSQPPTPEDLPTHQIRVLSLFDGIGTGKYVLDQLGFDVEVYYASEIDQDAINVTKMQHKDNVVHLGDVTNINVQKLKEIGPVDLLIGGSPCNELSLCNPARKGLGGGTGLLFFEYHRILNALQKSNQGKHVFWLFENVVSMPKEVKATISRFFGCEPAKLNSKYFSAQQRARYFWGNLPGIYCPPQLDHFTEKGVCLNKVLTPFCNRVARFEKIQTITTNSNSFRQGKKDSRGELPVMMDGKQDTLWIPEVERLFGFPSHYTDIGYLGPGKRQKLIGKSWSIGVIRHLFTPLKQFFTLKESTVNGNKETIDPRL